MQENIQYNLKKTMEDMTTMNQARTDVKFKEITKTKEITQI
jgi:hypothetical protein